MKIGWAIESGGAYLSKNRGGMASGRMGAGDTGDINDKNIGFKNTADL